MTKTSSQSSAVGRHSAPRLRLRPQHTGVDELVDPRPRDRRGDLLQKLQQLEEQMRRPVPEGPLQLEEHLPVVSQLDPFLGHGWSLHGRRRTSPRPSRDGDESRPCREVNTVPQSCLMILRCNGLREVNKWTPSPSFAFTVPILSEEPRTPTLASAARAKTLTAKGRPDDARTHTLSRAREASGPRTPIATPGHPLPREPVGCLCDPRSAARGVGVLGLPSAARGVGVLGLPSAARGVGVLGLLLGLPTSARPLVQRSSGE
jgi:hypothetical protein